MRAAHYAFDESQRKPYYELNHVLLDGRVLRRGTAVRSAFKERHDLPVYEPDVRVFDVFDEDGSPLAIFIADLRAPQQERRRLDERVRVAVRADRHRPVVANHLNIPKPPPASRPC